MPRPAALTAAVATLSLFAVAMPARAAFNIVLTASPGLAANGPALDAFQRAAAQWEARFSDDVEIDITADLTATGFASPSIIGGASPVLLQSSYNTVRQALIDDAASNEAIVGFLPTAANFTATTPSGRTLAPAVNPADPDATLRIIGTQANFKALGFTGITGADAAIKFNSAFSFDYDNRDGVSPGLIDFESVAVHEIGHSLGFTSIIDLYAANPDFTSVSPEILDLFRFADNVAGKDPSTAAEFSTFARKLDPGTANFDDATSEFALSTITDGRQASHWKADEQNGGQYIGIMDPTFSGGVGPYPITAADLRAFGLIGYDVNAAFVPEPATLAALGGLAALGLRRRRGGGGAGAVA